MMKTLTPFSALTALVVCLSACSDSFTEIDGRSQELFLESSAQLKATLPTVQRPLFENSLTHLQRERDFSKLDGMEAEEILEAEADRLKEVKAGRVAKLEKFEGYERKFTEQGSEVPKDIVTTLEEVRAHILSIDQKLEILEDGSIGPGSSEGEEPSLDRVDSVEGLTASPG